MSITVKYIIKQVFTVLLLLGLSLVILPQGILAVGYGVGKYNVGNYNNGDVPTPTPTSAPTNTGGNSTDSSSNTTAVPASDLTCYNPKPAATPDLFQITSTSSSSVKVYFTPVSSNRDRYFISYSTDQSAEQFGFEFLSDFNGVISVDIQALKPNTTYYFKVRAGNGCMPGDWSGIVSAKPGQLIPTYKWSSLPQIVKTAFIARTRPAAVQEVQVDTSKPTPTPSAQQPAVLPSSKPTTKPAPSLNQTQTSPNIFQKIGNFFTHLFGS